MIRAARRDESASAGPAHRLFFALWPTAPVRESLLRCQRAQRWSEGARPTPAERLHLTLHFLGAVPGPRLAELVRRAAVPHAPIDLRLDRAALWPHGNAVLEASAPPEPLLALHAALAAAIQALGLTCELRHWRPHVTLARHAAGSSLALSAALRWQARGYVLVESAQGYRLLHRYR